MSITTLIVIECIVCVYKPAVAQLLVGYTCDGPFPAPPAPTSYTISPGLTVYEGPVAPDPANPAYATVKAALRGYEASVAIARADDTSPSNFIVAWASEPLSVNNMQRDTCVGDPLASNYIFVNRFSAADGHCLTWTQGGNVYGPKRTSEVAPIGCSSTTYTVSFPSISATSAGWTQLAWMAQVSWFCGPLTALSGRPSTVFYNGFKFTDNPAGWPSPVVPVADGLGDHQPTAAVTLSANGQPINIAGWARTTGTTKGLLYQPGGTSMGLRDCGSGDLCNSFSEKWQPAVAASGS